MLLWKEFLIWLGSKQKKRRKEKKNELEAFGNSRELLAKESQSYRTCLALLSVVASTKHQHHVPLNANIDGSILGNLKY